MEDDLISIIKEKQNIKKYKDLNWEGSFKEYLDLVCKNPKVARSAQQRLYDMILSYGTEECTEHKNKIIKYKIFNDPISKGEDAVFGLEEALMSLVSHFKAAAQEYGTEKRILLLTGPVGSSKSTIVRLLKKGLEQYSKTEEGALYTFSWIDEDKEVQCPMHEEPLKLIPKDIREEMLGRISKDTRVSLKGDLCPLCRFMYNKILDMHDGNWSKVIENIKVKRLVLSEQDRVGIGTFQPKDEKNQDSTELSGDINYRMIAELGSDSDPRAFNFDGEFNIANRGIIEFIELLKLQTEFLYDLLTASQEHKIKPKKFSQVDIDEIIIGHTNEPELQKLQRNKLMDAFRDRTVRIDVPYVLKLKDEIKIYEKDYSQNKVKGKHIAPHTLEIASMWAVLTRLEYPKKAELGLKQKLKLYDGKDVIGFTEDNIKEFKEEAEREGMFGISPRYIQDKISNVLVNEAEEKCVNPFMVLNELEAGLKYLPLTPEEIEEYKGLLSEVKEEYEDVVKNEVRKALVADESALETLCNNYIENIKAYTQKEKVKNRFTGEDVEPDERLMRSIEEKVDIPEARKNNFRTEIMNYIGKLSLEGKKFDYKKNTRLQKALELKLFEDSKDSINLKTVVSNVVDQEAQKKIEVVKQRLINKYGYCDVCASDVLNYVASIFARGDALDNNG